MGKVGHKDKKSAALPEGTVLKQKMENSMPKSIVENSVVFGEEQFRHSENGSYKFNKTRERNRQHGITVILGSWQGHGIVQGCTQSDQDVGRSETIPQASHSPVNTGSSPDTGG